MEVLLDLLDRCEKLEEKLATIREAGNKLARVAKDYESIDDLLDAIGEWEAANK